MVRHCWTRFAARAGLVSGWVVWSWGVVRVLELERECALVMLASGVRGGFEGERWVDAMCIYNSCGRVQGREGEDRWEGKGKSSGGCFVEALREAGMTITQGKSLASIGSRFLRVDIQVAFTYYHTKHAIAAQGTSGHSQRKIVQASNRHKTRAHPTRE
jgi:hypothetical protein